MELVLYALLGVGLGVIGAWLALRTRTATLVERLRFEVKVL